MDGPAASCELDLPGFRFHPTEEELLEFYLKGVLNGKKLSSDVIGMVNIYHHEPWDLPGLAKIGEREWYFFVQRDRRHSHGGRPNRTTHRGFWKATGSDRPIRSVKDPKRVIGLRKTLVFYSGRAPRGCKTDWVMNEYRMPDASPLPQEDTVLCKIYRKATSLRTLGQRAAAVEQARALKSCITSSIDQASSPEEVKMHSLVSLEDVVSTGEKESEKKREFVAQQQQPQPKQQGVSGVKEILPELQLPKSGLEWMTDPFLLRSPWLDMWSPYANVLNF